MFENKGFSSLLTCVNRLVVPSLKKVNILRVLQGTAMRDNLFFFTSIENELRELSLFHEYFNGTS